MINDLVKAKPTSYRAGLYIMIDSSFIDLLFRQLCDMHNCLSACWNQIGLIAQFSVLIYIRLWSHFCVILS